MLAGGRAGGSLRGSLRMARVRRTPNKTSSGAVRRGLAPALPGSSRLRLTRRPTPCACALCPYGPEPAAPDALDSHAPGVRGGREAAPRTLNRKLGFCTEFAGGWWACKLLDLRPFGCVLLDEISDPPGFFASLLLPTDRSPIAPETRCTRLRNLASAVTSSQPSRLVSAPFTASVA